MSDFEYETNDNMEHDRKDGGMMPAPHNDGNYNGNAEDGTEASFQPGMNESGRYRYSGDPYKEESTREEQQGNRYQYQYENGEAGSSKRRYRNIPDEPDRRRRERKRGTGSGRIFKLIGSALIFGVVAGAAFTGVSVVKDHFWPVSSERIETTTAGDDTASSGNTTSTVSAQDVSTVVNKVMPSVVSITGTFQVSSFYGFGSQESQGAGSGFLIAETDEKLMIATNNHVVKGATSLTVGFCDDSTVKAEIVGTDADADLAVISVNKKDVSKDTLSEIKVATLGSSDDLKVGEAVVAIGNALGYGQSVTTGVVSAKDREVSFTDGTMTLLQTDAAINPGNSGGILINLKGQVIGINNAKLEDTSVEGMGYAIPISTAKTILDDLMNAGTISTKDAAFLGIVGKNIDSTYSQALGMPSGIYVSQVINNSPAEKAGIAAGDVITEFEGNRVSTMDGLKSKIAMKKAGSEVKITVKRANQNGEYEEKTIKVTLGKESDYEDESSSNSDESENQNNNSNNNGNYNNGNNGGGSQNPYEYYNNGSGNNNEDSYSPFDYFFN